MLKTLSILVFIPLNAFAVLGHSWWCTASGITLTYAKEQVWGSDQATLVEAKAIALSNCRAELSQCAVDACWKREGSESIEEHLQD